MKASHSRTGQTLKSGLSGLDTLGANRRSMRGHGVVCGCFILLFVNDLFDSLFHRKAVVQHLIQSFQRTSGTALAKSFRVNYKRHVLTMDDLGTLYGQNWLNDQVQEEPQ